MSYLVDTNVFSELAKPKPDARVVQWLRDHEHELYVSTITIGEIRRGIEGLPSGKKGKQDSNYGSSASANTWMAAFSASTPARPMSGVS